MGSQVPVIESANVWGLIGLKKGEKRKPRRALSNLRRCSKPIESVDDIRDGMLARRVAFRAVKRQLNLWKGPVHKNRLADQLIFPLNETTVKMAGSESPKLPDDVRLAKDKKQPNTFQQMLYNNLYLNPRSSSSQCDPVVKCEGKIRSKLLETISVRRKERFLRAIVAAKNKRRNKIKSKKFHKHKNGRALKQYEKEVERLRQDDPRAFADHLLKAQLDRAKERASLRHHSGSKFAKMQKLRANYDNEARAAVAEMYQKSTDLTRRIHSDDSSGSDGSDVDVTSESDSSSSENDSFNENSGSSGDEHRSNFLSWWRKPSKYTEPTKTQSNKAERTILSTLAADNILSQCCEARDRCADRPLSTEQEADIPDSDSDGFFRTLAETCSSDPSLRSQFVKEKDEVVNEETPKDIDVFLPGWNSWTGPGLEAKDEQLRKGKLVTAPKVEREDSGKPHLLVRRRLNTEFKQHLIKSIPFPYNTPEQFEAFIAQPISREWLTEAAHRELIRPKITIQSGRIIRPLSRSAALLRDKDVERLTKED